MRRCEGLLYRVGRGVPRVMAGHGEIRVPAGATVRFDLASGGHWYGHGFAHTQPYPLETGRIVNEAFAVNNIQCPIWMCSAGYAIYAETNALLKVRVNAEGRGALEIESPAEALNVFVFHGPDLPAAHRQLMAHLGWPPPAPDARFLGDCVFCTWTQYPRCITQARVVEMARAIRERGYPCSTFTIDDRWESAYGELRFSRDFPDPAAMVRELHDLGFQVLLWVTPFVNREASTFDDLASRGILVPRRCGTPALGCAAQPGAAEPQGAALLTWWGGEAGLIDLTGPAGRDWFRARLVRLRTEFGVDGFKVDGGDAKYQPPIASAAWRDYRGASGYADLLLAVCEDVAPGACETRTAWLSQSRRIVWRQGGKDSHWGLDNGLAAMVTLGLHVALLGYDLFMPDMIPGRVQTLVADMALPTDELMVRWTEVSAFLPVMQFSYFPWNYAPETAAACRAYALVHKALEPYLLDCLRCRGNLPLSPSGRGQGEGRGRSGIQSPDPHPTLSLEGRGVRALPGPLVRPVWYDEPEREDLYTVADEFLLGPDLLVAPVLSADCVERDLVLPRGPWRDAWTGAVRVEERLERFPAPCPGIPVFVRATNDALFERLHRALDAIPRGGIASGRTTTAYSAGVNRDLTATG